MKVIFSSDTLPMYMFCLPLTSLLWKTVGFEPICLLAGLENEWENNPLNKFVLTRTKETGAEIYFIGHVPGTNDGTVSQVSRLFSGCINLPEDEYVLTSDVDMWPLNKTWFHQKGNKVNLFYANAYNHEKYPMCYIGTSIKYWREIMDIIPGKHINDSISHRIITGIGENASFMDSWNFDELLFGQQIKKWSGYPSECHMINRNPTRDGPPEGRIDRYNWSYPGYQDSLIDAHLLRMPWKTGNWELTYPILRDMLSNEEYNWCINYRKEFMNFNILTESSDLLLHKLGQ